MKEFKGIKQVLFSTFNNTQDADKIGYLWFVRKSTEDTIGSIYLGTRQYGSASTGDIAKLETIVGNVLTAVGLDENGEYVGSDPSYTIISGSNSVQEALQKLDAYARQLEVSMIKINPTDKILSVNGENAISTTLGINYNNGELSLIGNNSEVIATVNLPKEQFLKSAEIVVNPEGQPEGKYLMMTFSVEGDADQVVYINVNDLVDVYTAGGGIKIENNVISINDEALQMIQYSDSEVRRLEKDKVPYAYDVKTGTNINILVPEKGSLLGNYGDDNAVLVKAGVYETENGVFKQTEVGSSKVHLNLNSSDRPTVETKDGKEEIAYKSDLVKSVQAEVATEDTVNAGHIELKVNASNEWYAQMYYGGDDVE